MNEIIIKGIANVDNMTFTDIEGGFGAGKKAMLAKDIAEIHNKDLRHINENINKNHTRFKNGVDIIDVKGTKFAVGLVDSGIFTQNAVNAANNIYILSERGYAKLLKILEDDVAWEQYEKLVDGYFNMRAEQNIPKTLPEALRLAADMAEKVVLLNQENKELTAKIQTDAPKVLFADSVSASSTSILVGEMAKILKQNGVDIGGKRFFEWLRSNGYLITRDAIDRNMPSQRSMNLGLFEIKETAITNSDGKVSIAKTPKITGKGQLYFLNLFVKQLKQKLPKVS